MADAIDQAQEREHFDREQAIAAAQRRIAESMRPGPVGQPTDCIDCAEPIETARLEALRGCTSRCASCAHDFERKLRHG